MKISCKHCGEILEFLPYENIAKITCPKCCMYILNLKEKRILNIFMILLRLIALMAFVIFGNASLQIIFIIIGLLLVSDIIIKIIFVKLHNHK